jgi:hypothetical protein
VVVDAAEHHVAAVLHYHVQEEEEVHYDIVDNSWAVVDHDYYIQEEVLLHVGNLGVVVHNSCLTVLVLLEAVDHDYYTLAHPHAANFVVVVHSDHYLSNRSETAPLLLEADHDIHVHVQNFGVADRVDEVEAEQVLHRNILLVVEEAEDHEAVVAADIEVGRSSLPLSLSLLFFCLQGNNCLCPQTALGVNRRGVEYLLQRLVQTLITILLVCTSEDRAESSPRRQNACYQHDK